MEEKDREIWVGKNRVILDKDNVLHFTIVGDVNENMAIAIEGAASKLANMAKGKVNSLIDLSNTGRASIKARKVFQERILDKKTGRIALFGLNPVAKVMASFVMGAIKKEDMRFFKTKEEALRWVKE